MANKGSGFEREICKTLSLWWSGGARDDIYWRTDNSGGRAKFRKRYQNKSTFGQSGDIQAIDPIGQPLLNIFTIELKRGYSKNTIIDMLDKRPRMAVQQWEKHTKQVIGDAKNAGSKYWMLISRRDKRETLIDIPYIAAKKLNDSYQIFFIPHIKSYLTSKKGNKISVYTTCLSDFLEIVKPEGLKTIF